MTTVTTKILMSLIEGYAETRHLCGRPEYNEKSAQARTACIDAIEALVKAAATPLVFTGKERPFAVIGLPVIDPELLEVGEVRGCALADHGMCLMLLAFIAILTPFLGLVIFLAISSIRSLCPRTPTPTPTPTSPARAFWLILFHPGKKDSL